jgi:prepilin-type N-terminal cleavage/methylation domain-containing protein/prepilin-type processing-associated H-X9-DG protein
MKQKFTLIELLVVIAIIGIITSMLLPSLSRAREKSKSAVCKSNLKQIGQFASMASDDNDQWTVSLDWSHFNKNYTGTLVNYSGTHRYITQATQSGLYHCPSLDMSSLAGTSSADYQYTSYGVNGGAVDYDAVIRTLRGSKKINEIVDPSNKVYFLDITANAMHKFYFDTSLSDAPFRWHGAKSGLGKSNVNWFDGSVSIEPGDFDAGNDAWDKYFHL